MFRRHLLAILGVSTITLHANAQWSNMQPSAGPVNGAVNDFELFQGLNYAGGAFTSIDGVAANHVACWTGFGWAQVGGSPSGAGANGSVRKLHVHDDTLGARLFVAGNFTTVDGSIPANGIATWDGLAWSPVGVGQTGIQDMDSWGNLLVASCGAAGVKFWNGTAWAPPPAGAPTPTNAIAVYQNQLFVGSTGGSVFKLSAPNGVWVALVSPLNTPPLDMEVFQGDLYIGSRSAYSGLAVLNSSLAWSVPGGVVRWAVACMSPVDDCVLFAGGFLDSANGLPVNNVARWNGVGWSALAGGVTDPNFAWAYGMCAVPQPAGIDVYVGGDFSKANGAPADNVAKWSESGGVEVIETLTVHTGQVSGAPGLACSPDDQFTCLTAAALCGCPLRALAFNAVDFAGALTGPAARVINLAPIWGPNSLPCDADARWISSGCINTGSILNIGTGKAALYGTTFNVTSPSFASARISICWRSDDWLGDGFFGGPNSIGVFVNEIPLSPLFTGFGGWVTIDDAPIVPGINELHVYPTDMYCFVGGLILSAKIEILDCAPGCNGTDTDGDGTPDCEDGCPVDASKTQPGVCGCGVLDTDTDHDGAPDCLDGCPNDPHKIAPGPCDCGVDECAQFCPAPGETFCSPGADAVVCPCAGQGQIADPGHGCGNSTFTGGALLSTAGIPDAAYDSLQLTCSEIPAGVATIFLQGASVLLPGVSFGDGIRCAGGALIRLGVKNDGDADNVTTFGPLSGDPQVSVMGGVSSGDARVYQTYYRNPNASWCPPNTFNITQAISMTWL